VAVRGLRAAHQRRITVISFGVLCLGLFSLAFSDAFAVGKSPMKTNIEAGLPETVTSFPTTPRRVGEYTYRVYWDIPDDNGSRISDYVIYAFTCEGEETSNLAYTGAGTNMIDFGPGTEDHDPPLRLTPGISYKFTVRSRNGIGWDEGGWKSNKASPCTNLEINDCLDPVYDQFDIAVATEPVTLCQ